MAKFYQANKNIGTGVIQFQCGTTVAVASPTGDSKYRLSVDAEVNGKTVKLDNASADSILSALNEALNGPPPAAKVPEAERHFDLLDGAELSCAKWGGLWTAYLSLPVSGRSLSRGSYTSHSSRAISDSFTDADLDTWVEDYNSKIQNEKDEIEKAHADRIAEAREINASREAEKAAEAVIDLTSDPAILEFANRIETGSDTILSVSWDVSKCLYDNHYGKIVRLPKVLTVPAIAYEAANSCVEIEGIPVEFFE